MILRELLAPLGVLEEEKTAAQEAPPGPLDMCGVEQTTDEHIDRLVQETISRLAAEYPRGAIPWCHEYRPDLVQKEREILARMETEDDAAFVQALRDWEAVQREMFAAYRQAQEATRQADAAQQEAAPASWDAWLSGIEIVRCSDLSAWEHALAEARVAGVVGWDMETTGLDPLQNRIRLVQLAIPRYPANVRRLVRQDGKGPEAGSGAVVYMLDLFALPNADRVAALEYLAALVADHNVAKVGHNLKFDIAFLRCALGRRLRAEGLFDVMLASQVAVAGDHVIYAHLRRHSETHGLKAWLTREERQSEEYRRAREESGAGEGTVPMQDAHGHWILWEVPAGRDEDLRPWYPTHRLGQVAHRHLEVWLGKELQASDWAAELSEEQIQYAAWDAAVILPLHEILSRLLALNRLKEVAKLEFACLPAAVEVELSGMPFDAPEARRLLQAAEAEAARQREALASLAEEAGFRPRPKKTPGKKQAAGANPDSSADMLDCLRLLAGREGLLAGEKLVAGGEEFPLDSRDETLARAAARLPAESALGRFAEALRGYRAAKKKADFLRSWLDKLHPATDRLHADLRQLNPNGVGRFSAKDPNLQQAPRGSDVRSLFRAPAGRKLVVADYSAIEMRIMARLSGDRNLLTAFRAGADVHRRTAAAIAGKAEEEVTAEERQAAKAAGFGLIYGMQADTLRTYAEVGYGIRLTLEEAERLRERFFAVYPAVAAWHRRQDRRGYEDGFERYWRHDAAQGFYAEKRPCVRTLAGRLRVWPVVERERKGGDGSYLRKAGSFTELYNTPNQGTGADIIKAAMARVYRELLARGWEDVRLIACVHDELVLEVPEALAAEAATVLKECMERAGAEVLAPVPVEVEVGVGDTWGDKQ